MNISPSAFNQARLIEGAQDALEASEFPANLPLEITEQAMIRDYETCVTHLKQLRALGIEVVIDDFGAGYSNLKHLASVPSKSNRTARIMKQYKTWFQAVRNN